MVYPCESTKVFDRATKTDEYNEILDQSTSAAAARSHSRPLLAFKHNPKAGGESARALLRELKDVQLRYGVKKNGALDHFFHDLLGDDSSNVSIDDSWLLFTEFEYLHPYVQNHAFVISSMREPCDQYVSLWAFGSAGGGALHDYSKKNRTWTKLAYGQDAPLYNSERDINSFRNLWMDRFKGLLSFRFHQIYSVNSLNRSIFESVDCWIYVDNYQATLYSCLREYENQGGYVNWTKPMLASLTRNVQEQYALEEEETVRLLKDDKYSKKGLGSKQLSHHSNCSHYYDDALADEIRYSTDKAIYETFGYEGCCGKRVLTNTPLIRPPPLATLFQDEKNKTTIKSIMNDGKEILGASSDILTVVFILSGSFLFVLATMRYWRSTGR